MTRADHISPDAWGACLPCDKDSVLWCDREGEMWQSGQMLHSVNQGFSIARHLRTKNHEEGGVSSAFAVYTKSPTLPCGVVTIDVNVAFADRGQCGISMV